MELSNQSNKKAKDLEREYKAIMFQARAEFKTALQDAARALKEAKDLKTKFDLEEQLIGELSNYGFTFSSDEWQNSSYRC